jgi:two-component system CheB/CheR fusion protein
MKILIIEDHRDCAEAMARVLRKLGHEAIVADTCAAAVLAVQHAKPDLALCDLGLPDGDGWELMQALREVYQLHSVAVTGHGELHYRQRCEDAGFRFIVKPFRLEQLRDAVERIEQR